MLGFSFNTTSLRARQCNPVGGASIVLDFTSGTLPAGIQFSRASSATVVNASGVQVTVPADVPRFDHDPQTGAPLGLLIEQSAENLLPSADFSTYQSGTNTTVQPMPAVTGPDGQTGSVYRLSHTSQSSTYLKLHEFVEADAKTLSLWVKAMGAETDFQLYADGSAGISGVMTATDDWTRVSHSAARAGQWGINNGPDTYGTDILVALPQIEFGLIASSYIPTPEGPALRDADVVQLDNISGVYDVTLRYGSGVEETWNAQTIGPGWWPTLSETRLARMTLRAVA